MKKKCRSKPRRPKKKPSAPQGGDQRQRILKLLNDSPMHMTAEKICLKLKKSFPRLNTGSVKKHLGVLKEQGQVLELDFGRGLAHFDTVAHSHYHFVCKNCHKIYDIKIPAFKELDDRVRTITGFRIYSHRLKFFGLCDDCSKGQVVR